jgi:hypothetical protein
MTTRPNQKESQNQDVANFIPSLPIKRRFATPDRLYRMMQFGGRATGNNFRFYRPRGSVSLSGGNP